MLTLVLAIRLALAAAQPQPPVVTAGVVYLDMSGPATIESAFPDVVRKGSL